MTALSRSLSLSLSLVVGLLSAAPAPALAHGVVIDGSATDWTTRAPNGPNLGLLARSATSSGEFVWVDARLDARTDFATPEPTDFTRFAVTADATNVYFLIELGAAGSVFVNPPQIQIAIDVDRVSGSGEPNFAGFADTTVAAEAEWEFLVQTLGFSSARLRDTTFTVIGTPAFASTGGVVEIAVPWSMLEMSGRSIDVLRFSVALFREDAASAGGDTLDSPGTSDALDVMTDYGDPTTGTFPNTFAEVSDGVLNYSVDVWFDRTRREPYAPIVVTRYLSAAAAGGTEWIELRNQTPLAVDLAGFCVGDEETPTTGESMQCFPTTSLATGARVVIADSALAFAAQYGASPDFEEGNTDLLVPDLTPHGTWTAAPDFALNNTSDEILVLGFHNTVVDLVNYGVGAYPGVTPRAAPATGTIATRSPVAQDTDDCAVDFPDTLEDCGPLAGTCSACRTCTRFACVADVGASCDDGDGCTVGTTCSAAATCGGGTARVCNDGNQCTTDTCSSASAGGCVFTETPGVACNDGRACTTGDVCISGIAGILCAGITSCDDANPCTADACDAGGACTHTPTPGVLCNDGNACTTLDVCSGTGTCGGTALVCVEDANPCTTATCVPATGCGFVNNTVSCSDGNACTVGDVCAAGACSSGAPMVCADTNACTSDACVAGACVFTPTTGTTCNDGDACTTGDVCSSTGTCAGAGECDAGVDAGIDAGEPDTGVDAGTDAGMDDDAGADDDSGIEDAGIEEDAGLDDAGIASDAGDVDATIELDVGPSDAGDVGPGDGGPSDTGPRDTGGSFDSGPVGADVSSPGLAGGCGCRTSSRRGGDAALVALFGLAWLLVRRRR